MAVELLGAVVPEWVEDGGGAEVVGHQVEEGLGALVPEFFGALPSAIDPFDGRLDVVEPFSVRKLRDYDSDADCPIAVSRILPIARLTT